MGYSTWSSDAADHMYKSTRATSTPDKVFTSKHGTHKDLNPKDVKVRESRDSKEHPESNAVIIAFDVTGSMRSVPEEFAMKSLPKLMRFLVTHGAIEHPQILFAAIGDAHSDLSPLQVCQFESGMEMDQDLTKIHLEGAGGGGRHESYELGVYWAARHTAMDCMEKRNKKGYLFLIGDEMPYDVVSKSQVMNLIGDKLQGDIPVAEILEEASTKFEVFFIYMHTGSYTGADQTEILNRWKGLLHERVLHLKEADAVCETIAAAIASNEGHELDEVRDSLIKAGSTPDAAAAATKTMVAYVAAAGKNLVKGKVDGALQPKPSNGKVERL